MTAPGPRRSTLRLRAAIGAHVRLVAAALVVLAAIGAGATYVVYVEEPTRTDSRAVESWRTTGSFAHSATVVEGTDLYPAGTVLSDRPYYFTAVSPGLDGTLAFTYETRAQRAAQADALTVTGDAWLVVRSLDARDGTEYWRTRDRVATVAPTDLAPGESLRVPFVVDVAAVGARVDRIHEQLGTVPGDVAVTVEVRLATSGRVDGRSVSETFAFDLPIAVAAGGYAVDTPAPVTQSFSTLETVAVARYDDLASRLLGPLSLVAGLVCLIGLGLGRRRGAFAVAPEAERLAAHRADRAAFADWIAAVQLPDGTLDGPAATVASLRDLVDVAAATGSIVAEDPRDGRFHVVHGGIRYSYVPPVDGRGTPGDADVAVPASQARPAVQPPSSPATATATVPTPARESGVAWTDWVRAVAPANEDGAASRPRPPTAEVDPTSTAGSTLRGDVGVADDSTRE